MRKCFPEEGAAIGTHQSHGTRVCFDGVGNFRVRERGWIGNRGTVNKEENELVPQDLQNVLLAKVCSTYTKENVLKEANILFWFGQNNTSSSIQPMMLISLDIS